MPVLAEFSLGDLILSMLWLFFLVIWFWLVISIFADLIRSRDLSGFAKALWALFIIFAPILGSLIYLIVRGSSMHERAIERARQADAEMRDYVTSVAGGASPAAELERLAALKDAGHVSPEEYDRLKAKIIG